MYYIDSEIEDYSFTLGPIGDHGSNRRFIRSPIRHFVPNNVTAKFCILIGRQMSHIGQHLHAC